MKTAEIVKFLKTEIQPLEDSAYGPSYRASVYLTDGTYLPAVIFRSVDQRVALAVKRLEEERSGKGIFNWGEGKNAYSEIVKHFTTTGNRINEYDIQRIEPSPFAFPEAILAQIKGETSMGWTGFVAQMQDGNRFAFGTSFSFYFFQFPEGYEASDISKIINHSYLSKSGELKSHQVPFFSLPDDYDRAAVHRERPFFECFVDGL